MPVVKVEGTNFVRDTKSMLLINRDDNAKNEYTSKVQIINTQKQEINKVRTEMDCIKTDILEIKKMMQQLLNKG